MEFKLSLTSSAPSRFTVGCRTLGALWAPKMILASKKLTNSTRGYPQSHRVERSRRQLHVVPSNYKPHETRYLRTYKDDSVRFQLGLKALRLRAVEHVRRMRGGAQSQLMLCDDGFYYVVKLQNNPQGTRILVNDFLGTRLGHLIGLPMPVTAIVDVSPQ